MVFPRTRPSAVTTVTEEIPPQADARDDREDIGWSQDDTNYLAKRNYDEDKEGKIIVQEQGKRRRKLVKRKEQRGEKLKMLSFVTL